MPMSRACRAVVQCIGAYGVDIQEPQERWPVEVDCLLFFPNHIIGVCNTIMQGGDLFGKLERAQEQGWPYFRKAVRSMLRGRRGAQVRPAQWDAQWGAVDPSIEEDSKAFFIYRAVAGGHLVSDFSLEDLYRLAILAPQYTAKEGEVWDAIAAARRASVYSVPYFLAILEKNFKARRKTWRVQDRLPHFEPGARTQSDSQSLRADWEARKAWERMRGEGG